MPPSEALPAERVTTGIALGVAAYTCFSWHDATNKWLVASLPVWEVLFCRSLTILIGCIAIGRGRLLERAITSPVRGPMALRGALTLAAWLCYYTAARTLSLAELLTLYFSAPLLTTVLAIPILGERVSRGRWFCLGLGFLGTMVATDPFAVRFSPATFLVLIAAAMWGYAIILMRQIARREPSLLQIFYQNLVFLIVTGALCAVNWITPTRNEVGLLLAVGILGGIGQFMLVEGVRHAPAAVMATVEYTALIWGFILGYVVFGDIPAPHIFVGAGLIIASGLVMVMWERRGHA